MNKIKIKFKIYNNSNRSIWIYFSYMQLLFIGYCFKKIYEFFIKGTSSESGHYYTFARENSQDDSEWILFDDFSVSKMKNE